MRRLLALALPLVAAAGMLPAAAAPAESSRAAVVRVALPADEGEVRVTLEAISRAAGPFLVVTVKSCDPDCVAPRYYEGALPKGSLTVDPDSAVAHLKAVIGGVSFDVTWRPADRPGAVAGNVHGGGTDESSRYSAYNGAPASAAVTVSTGSCRTDATVGDQHEVSMGSAGNTTAAPLSRLRLRPAGAPSCAD